MDKREASQLTLMGVGIALWHEIERSFLSPAVSYDIYVSIQEREFLLIICSKASKSTKLQSDCYQSYIL